MALFHDEFEPKVVNFDKDWVSIRPLPRSYFDREEQELVNMTKGIRLKGFNNGKFELEEGGLDSEELNKVVEREKQLEYEKIKNSIVEWSSNKEVSIENIKKLPGFIYDRILKEITEINFPTEKEVKN
jgi:hypothetical protein